MLAGFLLPVIGISFVRLATEIQYLAGGSSIVFTLGYFICCLEDFRSERRFRGDMLILFAMWILILLIVTPILMSAAVAHSRYRG